jgi:hypothetical protein
MSLNENEILTKAALTAPQKMANREVPMMKAGATEDPKYSGVELVLVELIPLVLYIVFKCGSCNFIND